MRHKNDYSFNEWSDRVATLPAPRIAENGYRLPDPLPAGLVLTDATQRQWLLGKSIGCGGFGEIYCAKELPENHRFNNNNLNNESTGSGDNSLTNGLIGDNTINSNNSYNGLPKRRCVQKFKEKQILKKNKEKLNKLIKDSNYPFVVKVDHMSGPLFAEMHFYHRVAKPKLIDNWMLSKRLAFIGMPRYVASGIYLSNQTCRRYRFLVLDRLGVDLQKILNKQNNKLSLKSVYTIAMMTLDILAYIHSFGYIHADIKASNLLLGRLETTSPARELYLVDYGLVERYRTQNGEHKEEEEDNRRANSGTIEFTSRDGHVGALTRRSDLEILAYNTISWLSGSRLPWIDCKGHESVRKQKEYYMSHIDELLRHAFKSKSLVPKGLEEFIRSISRLGFKEDPDYGALKLILTRALVSSGFTNDGLIIWGENTVTKSPKKGNKQSVQSSPELGRGKTRRSSRQETFEQFELCEIPRKMHRNRGVRSAPTTALSRQRSGSISPINMADIEHSNPTPQMLEVLDRIRLKAENCERVLNAIDSNNFNSFAHKKRIRTLSSSKKGSKTRKLKLTSISNNNKTINNKKLKTTVNIESIRPQVDSSYDLKSVATNILKKSKRNTKKCSIVRRKYSTSPRIPLQKLEINVKTTTATKRCSSRALEAKKVVKTSALKRKTQQKDQKRKTVITRRKITKSTAKVLTKKLSKNRSSVHSSQRNGSQNRSKVSLVIDLPTGSLRCDKQLRTNGNKKFK